MASDLERRIAMEKAAKNVAGVPESLVSRYRRVVEHGAAFVDNKDAISKNLAVFLHTKAHSFVTYYKRKGDVLLRPAYGQIGFIRKDKIQTSPGGTYEYAVVPVTAKHNLRHIPENSDGEFDALRTETKISNRFLADLVFDDMNWSPSPTDSVSIRSDGKERLRPANWAFGVDIAKGMEVTQPSTGITSENNTFELVRDTFHLEVGQKVAIAVIFPPQSKPTQETVGGVGIEAMNVQETDLERIYGKPNEVNIYTGEITCVGNDHIEYDINTFTGCSGATVFLLDQDQPASVQHCDYGKAVAVHAGAHPFMADRNLGFKLRTQSFE